MWLNKRISSCRPNLISLTIQSNFQPDQIFWKYVPHTHWCILCLRMSTLYFSCSWQGDDNIAGGRSGRSGGGNYRAPSASSQPSGAAPNSARLKHGVHGTTHPSKHTTPSVKWTSKDKAGQQEMNNADGRDNSRTLIYDSQHHIKVPVIRKFSLSGKSSAQFKYPANGDEWSEHA